jgi:catechol-2,3-dioxygenase
MAALNILGLAGFGLEVPDLDAARRFYTAFGLDARDQDTGVSLRSPGRGHDEIVIVNGPAKRLRHLSFFIAPEAKIAFADKLQAAGLALHETPPIAGAAAGLWFQDPWGMWIHLDPRRPEPVPAATVPIRNTGGRRDRVDVALWQELDRKAVPRRIGHMLMFTQEWARVEKFYCEVLGFRTTDRAQGRVAFMAAGEGIIDHHCFGLINGTHRGIQHASFEVAGIDDIGFTAWRMREAGYKDGFGPGRHAIASNLFHYTRDPWGSWIECYADMDMVSDAWQCRDWQSLPYIWGPEWSPEFWTHEHNANFEPR